MRTIFGLSLLVILTILYLVMDYRQARQQHLRQNKDSGHG